MEHDPQVREWDRLSKIDLDTVLTLPKHLTPRLIRTHLLTPLPKSDGPWYWWESILFPEEHEILTVQTGAIDDVHRAVSVADGDEKIREGKVIIEELAKLKYEVQHNRNLT